ncbi:MAG: hypothetical protein MUF22_04475 [Chitinispirillaceae bacterium]|nr:hypothetical protein [Chitinispirillaceae bacterium]
MKLIHLSLATGLIACSLNAQIPSAGPVAYYPLDSTALDFSGNNHHGILSGTVSATFDRILRPGNAMLFNGTNSSVDLETWFNYSTFSVSMWINPAATQAANADIIDNNHTNYANWVVQCLNNDGTKYCLFFGNSGGVAYRDTNMIIIPAGIWSHLAIVREALKSLVYINGQLVSSKVVSEPVFNSTSHHLRLGTYGGGGRYWKGSMDDVRLYNSALSGDEIAELYRDYLLSIIIPIASSTNRRPAFSWHSVGIPATYLLQVDTTASFTSPIVGLSVSDTMFQMLSDLPVDSIYWRVKVDNSPFSATSSFRVLDSRVPALIPYQPKVTIERRPVLKWNSVAGAAYYTISIDTISNFSGPIASLPILDTSYTVLVDLPAKTIYWHVKSDLVSTWSSTDQFSIIADSVPFLIRYNGATVSDKRPRFIWKKVANATAYNIQIANNIGFSNSINLFLTDTAYSPLADLDNGTWYWRVNCSRNYALFSPVDSVVIDLTGISGGKKSGNQPFIFQTRSGSGIVLHMNGSEKQMISAEVCSITGKKVASLSSVKGIQGLSWNCRNTFGIPVPNGMYLLNISTKDRKIQQKIVVAR